MGRTFVMGDIHGRYDAMLQCFDRSGFNFKTDKLIQLGDICDGVEPFIYECVELLLTVNNLIQLRGNHDDWFITYLKTGSHPTRWLQGGPATYQSYCKHSSSGKYPIIPKTHIEFFNSMLSHYIDDKRRLFIHGGFDRTCQLHTQNVSEYWWNRTLFEKALCCRGKQKLKIQDDFTEIFIGHTATTHWNKNVPIFAGGLVWNIDTGSGKKGKLTIMDVDTKEYWQSDSQDVN